MPSNKSVTAALSGVEDKTCAILGIKIGTRDLVPGMFIPKADAQDEPKLSLAAPSSSATYMVVALDIDAPFPSLDVLGPILHWIQPGLRADGNVLQATEPFVANYIGPAPPPGSSPHRYCFFLYEQPQSFRAAHYAPANGAKLGNMSRMRYSLDEWEKKIGLGKILAMNYFKNAGCLNAIEGASLTCAGLTAWNALYGLKDKQVQPGQWVLTQGSGGVSIFAIQFAKVAGAKVISTTSSAAKANRLKELGADHIINYKETPNWGEEAKRLTGGAGVDHIIEVAGPSPMKQSLNAIRIEGVISIIGYVGGSTEAQPGFLERIVRGISVGHRFLMEDMCRAIEANPEKLKPVIDSKVFTFDSTKEAYEYQWSGQHFGKVGITFD